MERSTYRTPSSTETEMMETMFSVDCSPIFRLSCVCAVLYVREMSEQKRNKKKKKNKKKHEEQEEEEEEEEEA